MIIQLCCMDTAPLLALISGIVSKIAVHLRSTLGIEQSPTVESLISARNVMKFPIGVLSVHCRFIEVSYVVASVS